MGDRKVISINASAQPGNIGRRPIDLVLYSGDEGAAEQLREIVSTSNLNRQFVPEISIVRSQPELMAKLESGRVDVLLLDARKTFESMLEVCRTVRTQQGERHLGLILLVDGQVDQSADLVAQALELGADEVIETMSEPREVSARIHAVLRLKLMTDKLRIANHQLRILSSTDELTGLHNMRSFYRRMASAIQSCRQSKTALGLIMFDLDRLKSVNDSSNHLVGSHIISEVGKLIKFGNVIDPVDIAARYGGDEYIILTFDKSLEDTQKKAEKIRQLISKAYFVQGTHKFKITASMGAAWVAAGYQGPAEEFMKCADLMCYRSKAAGRNCTSVMEFDESVDLSSQEFDVKKSDAKIQSMAKIANSK